MDRRGKFESELTTTIAVFTLVAPRKLVSERVMVYVV